MVVMLRVFCLVLLILVCVLSGPAPVFSDEATLAILPLTGQMNHNADGASPLNVPGSNIPLFQGLTESMNNTMSRAWAICMMTSISALLPPFSNRAGSGSWSGANLPGPCRRPTCNQTRCSTKTPRSGLAAWLAPAKFWLALTRHQVHIPGLSSSPAIVR